MAKVVCFDFDDVIAEKGAMSRFLEVFGHTFKELEYGLELLEDNKNPRKFFRTIKKAIELGRGIKYSRVEKISFFLRPTRNASRALKKLKNDGYKIVVVSINDANVIKKFLRMHKMDSLVDHIYASKIGIRNGLLTGTISGDVVRTEKCGIVPVIEKKFSAGKGDIFYVGDGMTDLPIMKKLGRGILFCPNPVAQAEVLADRKLMQMKKDGRLFLVRKKDLNSIMEFIS
jgi:HAD superfamily phosphoserine phosphatase-like hydrolase